MSAPAKPTTLPLNVAGIPAGLRVLRAWVGWKWKLDRARRWTKVPVNVTTGRAAKSNDMNTWTDFDRAVQKHRYVGCDGIGLCRVEDLVFIDCDGVFDWTADSISGEDMLNERLPDEPQTGHST